MKHTKDRTDLDLWMHRNRITNAEFAAKMSAELGERVSPSTVAKWRLGIAVPRSKKLLAIGNVTDGEVNVQSFVVAKEAS